MRRRQLAKAAKLKITAGRNIKFQIESLTEKKMAWSNLRNASAKMLDLIRNRGFAASDEERSLVRKLISRTDAIQKRCQGAIALIKEFNEEKPHSADLQELQREMGTAASLKNYYMEFLRRNRN
ncbi:MAG: hypothetical protein HYW05_05025 [Candidatus Diapherotrites archaeon]|nr:hypothetical protein [Candidatus Diapherotrites archaeon]